MLEDGKLGLIIENSEEGIYEGMKKALTMLLIYVKSTNYPTWQIMI